MNNVMNDKRNDKIHFKTLQTHLSHRQMGQANICGAFENGPKVLDP